MDRDLDIGSNGGDARSSGHMAGRPRVIPEELCPVLIDLYRAGNGYRAIARVLEMEHSLSIDYSTVRRALLRLGEI